LSFIRLTSLVFLLSFSIPAQELAFEDFLLQVEELPNVGEIPFYCNLQSTDECPKLQGQNLAYESTQSWFDWLTGFKSPWKRCQNLRPRDLSADEFEKMFQEDPWTSLGLPSRHFGKTAAACWDKVISRFPRHSREDARRALIADSYLQLHRLSSSLIKRLRALKQIELLHHPLPQDFCDQLYIPVVREQCQKMNSKECKNSVSQEDLISQLEDNLINPVLILEKAKEQSRGDKDMIEGLNARIKLLKKSYPFAQDKKFWKQVKDHSVKFALGQALEKDREQLLDEVKQYNKHSYCLVENHDVCPEREEHSEFMRKVDKTVYQKHFIDHSLPKDQALKKIDFQGAIYHHSCLSTTTQNKEEGLELGNTFARDATFTIATALFTGGASLGWSAFKALSAGGKALKTGALASTLGINTYYFQESFFEMVNECLVDSFNLEAPGEKNWKDDSCPMSKGDAFYKKSQQEKSCLTSAIFLSMDALPFMPQSFKKTVTNFMSSRRCQSLRRDGKNLPRSHINQLLVTVMVCGRILPCIFCRRKYKTISSHGVSLQNFVYPLHVLDHLILLTFLLGPKIYLQITSSIIHIP